MGLLGKILRALHLFLSTLLDLPRLADQQRRELMPPDRPQPIRLTWSPEDGWVCMACKRLRPDQFIGVTHMPVAGMEEYFPQVRLNYRHCTDTRECVEQALALKESGGASPS